ncbi:MAG: NTP transferase domain-containing protein [Deltaproteobacteria bacterium]|nr:NTP transferase domain-containing protein [Deltaproteobacteria bacterium]
MPHLTAVILAAGRSSRFGQRHKALPEPWGVGLLAKAASIFKALGLERIVVVTGFRAEEVATVAQNLGLASVFNANFDQGMLSSVQTGLKAIEEGAALILPVDAAFVSPWAVLAVIEKWLALPAADHKMALITPVYNGQTGHPPIWGPEVIKEVLAGEDNPRAILARLMPEAFGQGFLQGLAPIEAPLTGPIRFVDLPDPGVLCDIDTQADYERVLAQPAPITPWPSPRQLWALLKLVGPGPRVEAHSLAVARGALRLGVALERVWPESGVDPQKGFLGGLIHDVDRLKKKHELEGQARLKALGWPELAFIVGQHKDLTWPPKPPSPDEPDWLARPDIIQASLAVYLADKYRLETKLVSLEDRFGLKIDSFTEPKARAKALGRLENARKVESWYLEKLGQYPNLVVGQRLNHPWESLADELEGEF